MVRQLLTNVGFLCVSFVTFQAAFNRTGANFTVVPLMGVERIGLDTAAIGLAITIGNVFNLATITFAGNLPGRTQTMPLAVYVAMQTDLEAAIALAVLLVAAAFALLFGLRAAGAPRHL